MKPQGLSASIYVLQHFIRNHAVEGIDTFGGAERLAYGLFNRIEKYHGRAEARRIFLKFGSPPSARRLGYIKNQALLDRLEMMKPEPNVQRLAQELAEQNKAFPREQRHGPRGSTNPITLEKHIRRLRDNRDNRRGWCNFPRG
jgi:hypothetical protein